MKAVLVVIDGLGIGEMPDVASARPQDRGANTLASIVRRAGPLPLGTLRLLGLGEIAPLGPSAAPACGALASYGRSQLAHPGADSYLGHQEIVGTIPEAPVRTLVSQVAGLLEKRLVSSGHTVRRPRTGKGLLIVDEALAIGDNLEADPGMNINVTVATDRIRFEEALKVGRMVRECVTVSRVIVFGGPGIGVKEILQHVQERPNGQIGVDSPSLGVYNENLQVTHMGYCVDPERQAPSLLVRQGVEVVLIGKMADLITCPGAKRDSAVPTPQVMQSVLDSCLSAQDAFIAATVQETDLAAHEGDALRMAHVLEQVDEGLRTLLSEIRTEDVLVICADHGNDPAVNVGLHTREETPLLIYQKGQTGRSLGVRKTLADIGATVTHLFGAPSTQDGSIIEFRRSE